VRRTVAFLYTLASSCVSQFGSEDLEWKGGGEYAAASGFNMGRFRNRRRFCPSAYFRSLGPIYNESQVLLRSYL